MERAKYLQELREDEIEREQQKASCFVPKRKGKRDQMKKLWRAQKVGTDFTVLFMPFRLSHFDG